MLMWWIATTPPLPNTLAFAMQPFCIRQRRNVCYTIINYSIQWRCCCCCCPCGSCWFCCCCCLYLVLLLLLQLLLYPWHLANATPRLTSHRIASLRGPFAQPEVNSWPWQVHKRETENWANSCSQLVSSSCSFWWWRQKCRHRGRLVSRNIAHVVRRTEWGIAKRELYFGRSVKCYELWLRAAQLLLQHPHANTYTHTHTYITTSHSGTFVAVTDEIWTCPKKIILHFCFDFGSACLPYVRVCVRGCECVLMRRSCCWLPFIVLFGICFGNTKLMITTALGGGRQHLLARGIRKWFCITNGSWFCIRRL